jgi:hypothetical protein
MNIDRKVVEQALEAWQTSSYGQPSHQKLMVLAMTAMQQALANSALDRMAENARELGLDYDAPVVTSDTSQERVDEMAKQRHEQPQREWVGLTDQEIENLWNQHEPRFDYYLFSCAIEAKLEEKNT